MKSSLLEMTTWQHTTKKKIVLLWSILNPGPKNRFATTPAVTGSDAVDIADMMPLVDGSSS